MFTTPDPARTEGHVASTMPLVLRDGTIIRGLRVRFEGGKAVEIDADENGEALRSALAVDENGLRLGELALVDGQGRIGPLGTVFYETLVSDRTAKTLAKDSGLDTDVLDPLEGITDGSRGDDYVQVMESNLEALQKALGAK